MGTAAPRWQEALEANQAPRVVLRATHEAALSYCARRSQTPSRGFGVTWSRLSSR
ncbi:MAG: DUF2237 family protein [Pseudolabrys sp.]